MLAYVWAEDENKLIGRDKALPWRLPADIKFFKDVTMQGDIVTGRKTYETIPNRRCRADATSSSHCRRTTRHRVPSSYIPKRRYWHLRRRTMRTSTSSVVVHCSGYLRMRSMYFIAPSSMTLSKEIRISRRISTTLRSNVSKHGRDL